MPNKLLVNTGLCLISSIVGAVIGSLAIAPSIAQSIAEDQIIRAKKISLLGKDGCEQIVLSVENSGPVISLKDSNNTQEVRLAVKEKNVTDTGSGEISFWNSSKTYPIAFLQSGVDGHVTLGMGHRSQADWVQLSTSNMGGEDKANLFLVFQQVLLLS